jgi:hypothetical protein
MKRTLIAGSIIVASTLFADTLSLQQGWNLKGTSNSLDIESLTDTCVETVWKFSNNKWQAYSTKATTKEAIESSESIDSISSIANNDGFWILTNTNCDVTIDLQTLSTPPLIGTFVDSPVANVDYNTTSGLEGTTDANGSFFYHKGDMVEFHIGDLVLGTSTPNTLGLITPPSLTDNDDTTTLLLQTLQGMDKDNNAENGIHIDDDIKEKLKALGGKHHIKDMDEESIMNLDDDLKNKFDKDHDGHMDINKEKAHKHFEDSMKKMQTKEYDEIEYNKEYKKKYTNKF